MDEQKKDLLKEKFSQIKKIDNKRSFDKLIEGLIENAKKRRDNKILN